MDCVVNARTTTGRQPAAVPARGHHVPVPGVPGLDVPSRLLTIEDAAHVLSIPATTLAKMVTARQVPCTRVGKHVRFTPGHIAAIITGGERHALIPTQRQREHGSARTRL
ncbi:helix-turn-helix domain-containing protein [Cellulomonas hominis]